MFLYGGYNCHYYFAIMFQNHFHGDLQVKICQSFAYQISIHAGSKFEGVLGHNGPKFGAILLKFTPEVVFSQRKIQCLKNLWKNWIFSRRGQTQMCSFVPSLNPVTSWRWPKSWKISALQEKLWLLGYPNMSKSKPFRVSSFWEITFLTRYLCYFW